MNSMKICKIDGCATDTRKGAWGYCGKHYARVKRYGDPHYITPESVRVQRLRAAQPNLGKGRKDVYKKLYGRHEHRVVAEQKIGRKLKKGEIVHHVDGNCHNNDSSNLDIITQSKHINEHRSQLQAGRNRQLTDEEVREIRASNLGGAELHRSGKYNASVWTIYQVKRGLTYRDVCS